MTGFLNFHDAVEWLWMTYGHAWRGPVGVLVVVGDHYEGVSFSLRSDPDEEGMVKIELDYPDEIASKYP